MKISVSTLALYPTPFEEVLSHLEERGVDYCEVINENPYHEINSELVDSYKINVSVHAPISDINIASHNRTMRNSSVQQMKNSIDKASKLEPGLVVVHPGTMPILGDRFPDKIYRYNLESLTECAEYAEDCGVVMCVENMPDIHGLLGKDIKELEGIIEEINTYMTLDVGHAHNMGFSTDEMLESKLIKHIHLSDNDGSFDSHNAIGSSGMKGIDFENLLKNLVKSNYRDILVVEVRNLQDVDESLDYLKLQMKSLK
ncbi:endonuclease 4 [anaerobic digester metagenome]